jgi:hypothetical protein
VIGFSLRPQADESRAALKAGRLTRTAGEGRSAN